MSVAKVNSADCPGEFQIVFKLFEDLKNLENHFERFASWTLVSYKLDKTFRKSQCKQQWV